MYPAKCCLCGNQYSRLEAVPFCKTRKHAQQANCQPKDLGEPTLHYQYTAKPVSPFPKLEPLLAKDAVPYRLGRRDGKYYISTDPAEPVARSCGTKPDTSGPFFIRRLVSKFKSIVRRGSKTAPANEHELVELIKTPHSHLFTTKINRRTYVVKLYSHPDENIEQKNHIHIFRTIENIWDIVTKDLKWLHMKCLPIRVTAAANQIQVYQHKGLSTAHAGYIMERIEPMNPIYLRALAKIWLKKTVHSTIEQDPHLSEVRLQVRMGEPRKEQDFTSTQVWNRPVYLDQLYHEAGRDIFSWSMSMGATLAILHWACRLDAKGVRFQMGMDRGEVYMWVSNFGECRPFDPHNMSTSVLNRLINAVKDNPCWPRPHFAPSYRIMEDPSRELSRIWQIFQHGYLHASTRIVNGQEGVPSVMLVRMPGFYMQKLESSWRMEHYRTSSSSSSGPAVSAEESARS